jgi:hypothetical protein
MEIERYTYICSLIIDCAAYRIGISTVQERIVAQHVPSLRQHYPGVSWTPDRVKRLFEADGLLDALAAQDRKAGRRSHPLPASSSVPSTVGDVIRATPSSLNKHADEIQYWLTKISSILEKLKTEEQRLIRALSRI